MNHLLDGTLSVLLFSCGILYLPCALFLKQKTLLMKLRIPFALQVGIALFYILLGQLKHSPNTTSYEREFLLFGTSLIFFCINGIITVQHLLLLSSDERTQK